MRMEKSDQLFRQLLLEKDLQKLVKFLIRTSNSILDIGCGIGDYLKYTTSSMKVVAVEPHLPYLDVAKAKTPWVEFHNTDGISFLENSKESFDCILLIDVVEHLQENEAIKLVNLAKEHSNNVVFSQIPIGLHEQHGDEWNLGGEFWQTHRSTWHKGNIDKLTFSFIEIWENWYHWEKNINKSNDTSIVIWIRDYDKIGFTSILKEYLNWLQVENYEVWKKAYEEGHKSSMGDHTTYFYNDYLAGIGLYDWIEKSNNIIEYGAADAKFMKRFINAYPGKKFVLAEYSDKLVKNLKSDFLENENVQVMLNLPELSSLSNIDLSFSFLLSQSMPKTLWKNHLRNVKSMLSKNGCYFFQFAYHPNGHADDQIQNGISGSNKYKPEAIYEMLEEAGYSGCDISVPVTLEQLNSDVIWYFCRAY